MKITENIFKQLKRMFSNDVIIRKVGDKKLKVIDTYNTQAMGSLATNYLNRQFVGLYSSLNYGYRQSLSIQSQRLMLFREYELMDQDPIINSALDLYAEEATVKDEYGKILNIKSDDKEIESILNNLFYDILNLDFNVLHWTRNLVKYGDTMMKLDLAERLGIVGVIPLSPYGITRVEGENPDNPYDVKYKIDGPMLQGTYENYEIAHFRLLTDSNFLPYGKSMIEGGRRIWKQLTLMEDAMLIHRIMRAPMKRVFKIDVGNLEPSAIDAYMEKIMNGIKKVPFVDSTTGDYNLRYNMQNVTEDFYLPTRGGDDSTSIDTLGGLEYNAIDDVEYLRNKLMSALRIPKAFLGYEESLGSKATLSQEDIRFARTVERIQKTLISEFKNIAIIHLFIQGYKDEDLLNFAMKMTPPSTIYEQEKIMTWKSRAELVDMLKLQKAISMEWIYKNIYQLGKDEVAKIKKQIIDDAKFEYRLQQIILQGNDPEVSGQNVDDGGTVSGVNNPDDIAVQGSGARSNQQGFGQSPGQPKDIGSTYETDKHVLGRNPLGKDDINKANKATKLKKIGMEAKLAIKKLSKKYEIPEKKINILGENMNLLTSSSMKQLLDEE